MRRRAVTFAALGVLAGCNQVYELERTNVRTVDAYLDFNDEDEDLVVNSSDNCPGIVNKEQRDDDDDGVGDECDPRPNERGDYVVARSFFNDPILDPDAWVVTTGARFEAGYVVQPTLGGEATLYSRQIPDAHQLVIEAGATVINWNNTTDHGLRLGLDQPGGYECRLEDSPTQGNVYLTPGGGPMTRVPENVPFVMRFALDRTTNQITCAIGQKRFAGTGGDAPPASYAVIATSSTVAIHYLIVYGADR